MDIIGEERRDNGLVCCLSDYSVFEFGLLSDSSVVFLSWCVVY